MVFGRFFGAKRHAKSDLKKSVREPFRIGPANTKSMSALLRQRLFRAKIAEKSHACRDIDFAGVLEGFLEGFGRPKSSIFALFSSFFRNKFERIFWKAKKSKKMAKKEADTEFWGRAGGMCEARGRDREGVIRRSRPRLLKLSNLGLKIFGKDLDWESSTRRHLRWGGGTLRAFRRPHIGCLEALGGQFRAKMEPKSSSEAKWEAKMHPKCFTKAKLATREMPGEAKRAKNEPT